MSDVGVMYIFRVAPEDAQRAEEDLHKLFAIMATEEFPTGDVKAYSVYRKRGEPGHFYWFEHFTEKGAADHSGPILRAAGRKHMQLMIEPFQRMILTPVLVEGCGAPIAGHTPSQGENEGGAVFLRYWDKDVAEENVEALRKALLTELVPDAGVETVGFYKDKGVVGQYCVFAHFADQGARKYDNGAGGLTSAWPQALIDRLYEQVWLDPVIIRGCGRSIPGAPVDQSLPVKVTA